MSERLQTIEERLDELSEGLALLAEEVRSERSGDVSTEFVAADAVLTYKRSVLKVVEWLDGDGREASRARRKHFHGTYAPVIGEDLYAALVSLRDWDD